MLAVHLRLAEHLLLCIPPCTILSISLSLHDELMSIGASSTDSQIITSVRHDTRQPTTTMTAAPNTVRINSIKTTVVLRRLSQNRFLLSAPLFCSLLSFMFVCWTYISSDSLYISMNGLRLGDSRDSRVSRRIPFLTSIEGEGWKMTRMTVWPRENSFELHINDSERTDSASALGIFVNAGKELAMPSENYFRSKSNVYATRTNIFIRSFVFYIFILRSTMDRFSVLVWIKSLNWGQISFVYSKTHELNAQRR